MTSGAIAVATDYSAEQRESLDIARALVRAGIPVFCAYPSATSPTGYQLPQGWQHAQPRESYIDAWKPGMALCAVMGHALDLIDQDMQNGGSLASLGRALPRVYGIAATPSGGTHNFVRSVGMRSRDNLHPGIDFKGGDADGNGRGFAFIAPTVRISKTTGEATPYRWIQPPDFTALGSAADPSEGEELRRLLDEVRGTKTLSGGLSPSGDISRGARNSSLMREAGAMRRRGLSASVIEAALQVMNEERCVPPLDSVEVAAIARSAQRYEPYTPMPSDAGSNNDSGAAAIDWRTFWTRDRSEPQFLVSPVLPAGRLVSIYAPPGTGKSLITLYVAACAATGRRVFDRPAGVPISVSLFDMEMTEDDVFDRLQDMGFGPDDDLNLLHYYLLPTLPPLDTPDGGAAITAIAERDDAKLVIIDTTSRVISGKENDADTLLALYRYTGMPLKAAGRTVVRLDHTGKDRDKGQRGTSAKSDDVDLVWEVSTREGGARLTARKRRQSWIPEQVDLVKLDDPVRYELAIRTFAPGAIELARLLDELGAPDSVRGCRQTLKQHGRKAANALLSDACQYRLQAAERATEHPPALVPERRAEHFTSRPEIRSEHPSERSVTPTAGIAEQFPPLKGERSEPEIVLMSGEGLVWEVAE